MGDEKAEQPPEKECRSRILRRLEQGRRITLVELDPPRSADIGGFMEGARQLEQAGADAITIADCPIGRARMDSSLLACKLSRELGIEALPYSYLAGWIAMLIVELPLLLRKVHSK